jgi:hypothetical protein
VKAKIICILVMTLLITTALPAVGTINNKTTSSTKNSGIEWSLTYGEDEYDVFYDVDVTDDGGYIMCGNREENDLYHPYVLKVDSTGTQEWNWTIREYEFNETICEIKDNWNPAIMQTSDGGYLTCLYIVFEFEGEDVLIGGLVKFDEFGIPAWFSYIGEEWVWWFIPTELIENETGYYAVSGLGAYNGDPPGDNSAGLVITDLTGTIIDHEFYNYDDYEDEANALCQTNDGGFLLTGNARTSSSQLDYWMIKTNSNLELEFSQTFARTGSDESFNHDCFQAEDGGFVMGGQSYYDNTKKLDAWIIRTDSECNMIWDKDYGDQYTDTCWSMAKTDDNKYAICVTMNFNGVAGDKEDTHIVKLDDLGNIEWIQINGGPDREVGISIKQTSDGGFIVAGRNGRSYSTDSDALLVKFAPFENQRPDKPDKPSGPTEGKTGVLYTFTTSTTDPDGDDILYKWDWGDGNYSDWLDTGEAKNTWNEKGKYLVKVMAKDEHCGESDWSDPLEVMIPKNKAIGNPILHYLQSHPLLFPILQRLLVRFGL